ncbi:MAG: KTSC domain-containing protein [Pyrinomonadaceae bacterium]
MSQPEMINVSSSNIESIGYDPENEQVYVQFLNGSTYIYKGVPIHEFENLRDSASLGSYMHRNFKNVYPYERIG